MIKKFFKDSFFIKKTQNNSLKQSIETVLDNNLKDTEGISKHERLMLLNILKIKLKNGKNYIKSYTWSTFLSWFISIL